LQPEARAVKIGTAIKDAVSTKSIVTFAVFLVLLAVLEAVGWGPAGLAARFRQWTGGGSTMRIAA
jgi:hypothetical protein